MKMNDTKRHGNEKTTRKRINKRAIVSITLLVTFIMMFVSAFVAHTTESFSVRHDWLHIHGYSGLTFTVATIIHIILNWRSIKRYLGMKR